VSIPANVNVQRDFSAGQIDEAAHHRDDTDLVRAALRRGLNTELMAGGGFRQRAGQERLFGETSEVVISFHVRPAGGVTTIVTLGSGRFTARLANGTLKANITGCPWTDPALPYLTWQLVGRDLIITNPVVSMVPQIFRYTAATDTWARQNFAFAVGLNGAPRQPYYRFAESLGITITPSARTGSITLTASAAFFVAGHIGVHFLLGGHPTIAPGRTVLITAVGGPTSATATVLEELEPTYRVLCNTTIGGFGLGQVVEGTVSGTKGVIQAINTGTQELDITVIFGYGFLGDEILVSPTSQTGVIDTGAGIEGSVIASPASLIWQEAFISNYRGWPGSVSLDIQRLMFTDFQQLPQAILWSAISLYDDFYVSGDETAAIFELIAADTHVFHVLGGYDQFAFTDRGIYYIPVSGSSPLIAGSVEFRKIESEGAARVRPQEIEGGHVFVNAGRTSLLAIRATGQTARPYQVEDISQHHRDLIVSPTALAVTSSEGAKPERYLYVVNDDGTMAMARYDRTRDWIGWVPWSTEGTIRHAHGFLGEIVFTVERDIAGVDTVQIERQLLGLIVDGGLFAASPLTTGLLSYASAPAVVVVDNSSPPRYYGTFAVNASGGLIDAPAGLANVWAGFAIDFDVLFMVPGVEGGQSVGQRMRRRRIARSALTTLNTQGGFVFHGKLEAAFMAGESQEGAAPFRNDTIRRRRLGRSFDPSVDLTRFAPGRIEVLEIAMEVGV